VLCLFYRREKAIFASKKVDFFHFWPKSEIDLLVPERDGGRNISLLGKDKWVQAKSPAAEAPSRCYDPLKSRFFPSKKFFLRQGVTSYDGHQDEEGWWDGM
jgi:hypothetical protein